MFTTFLAALKDPSNAKQLNDLTVAYWVRVVRQTSNLCHQRATTRVLASEW